MAPRRLRRARQEPADRGATAVEFALLFPIFLILCFGTISGGILFSDKLALTQGAREGARYGATLAYTSGSQAAFLEQVLDATRTAGYGQLGSGDVTYCAAFDTGPAAGDITHVRSRVGSGPLSSVTSSSTAKCPGTDPPSQPLPPGPHVVVTVVKTGELNLLLYRFQPRLSAMAVARFEGKL